MAGMPRLTFYADTSRQQIQVLSEPEVDRQFEKGKKREESAPKTDANGEVMWRVRVAVVSESDADVLFISVPGNPGVKQGELVRVEGLTVRPWEMEDRYGLTIRAASIKPVNARPAQAEKAAA